VPESPEVEVARRLLARWLEGAVIELVDVRDRLVAAGIQAARGMRAQRVERRGKQLRVTLGEGILFAHLGMSGRWEAVEPDSPALPYERARLVARQAGRAPGAVSYVDPRRLGRVRFSLTDTRAWRALGPDVLDHGIDAVALHARLLAKRGPIKAALLDQRLFAGVGNIHAIEGLWRARLDPRTRANALSLEDVRALARAVRASLLDGIRAHERTERATYVNEGGAPNPFRIYGRSGEPCPRCGESLRKVILAGRGTTFCPGCQRRLQR
jgi:formamidopyrimidine-DNA glycosylase